MIVGFNLGAFLIVFAVKLFKENVPKHERSTNRMSIYN